MNQLLAIIDYGMGNLRSVQKGLESVGIEAWVTADPETILKARGVVLPGVGAFADAMDNLQKLGLIPVLEEVSQARKPLLGICLGMQLFFAYSEENGFHRGLGILQGGVKRLPPGLKVPHMGWNQLEIKKESPLVRGIPQGTACYFVHSYYAVPEEDIVIATAQYGQAIPAIVGRDRVFGIQFHPEKSSRWGLQILKNYGELVRQC